MADTIPNPMNPGEAVQIVKDCIDTADSALNLYNRVLDQIIPWKTFEETIKEVDRFKDDYSQEAGQLVGEVKKLLLDAQDSYFESTQKVYQWCGITLQLMPIYLDALDDPSKAEAQQAIITKVLDDGVVKIESAIELLGKCSSSFNATAGKLTELDARFAADFDSKSSYFDAQVDKLRKEAYAGAAAGAIAGPFGLIISYSIAAGVLEGKLIPELKNKLESVKQFFLSMREKIGNSSNEVTNTKESLKKEMKSLGELKVQVSATRVVVDFSTMAGMKGVIVDSANKLVAACDSYQVRHGRNS